MADSDDDMGGLGPTTPAPRPKKTKQRAPVAGSSKPASKSKPSSKVNGRAAAKVYDVDNPSDVSVEDIIEEEQEASEVEPPLAKKQRTSRRAPASKQTNGKPPSNAKGKGKAAPLSVAHDTDTEMDDVKAASAAQQIVDALNASSGHGKRTADVVSKKVDALNAQMQQLREELESLQKLHEELLKTRMTEPEELMEAQKEQYEAQLEVKDQMIAELNKALAKKDPLIQSGKTRVVQLLTREAADEEKRMLEKDVNSLRDLAIRRKQDLEEEKQRSDELRVELQAEIERSKMLANRPNNRGRQGVVGIDAPNLGMVIRFYEEITNMLVTSAKVSPSKWPKQLELEDWSLTCVYTYVGNERETANLTATISFTVTYGHERANPDDDSPITSKDQLVPTIQYVPMELDKEPPEFVERLGYLAEPFGFQRDQLMLFIGSVHTKMGEALDPNAELEASDTSGDIET